MSRKYILNYRSVIGGCRKKTIFKNAIESKTWNGMGINDVPVQRLYITHNQNRICLIHHGSHQYFIYLYDAIMIFVHILLFKTQLLESKVSWCSMFVLIRMNLEPTTTARNRTWPKGTVRFHACVAYLVGVVLNGYLENSRLMTMLSSACRYDTTTCKDTSLCLCTLWCLHLPISSWFGRLFGIVLHSVEYGIWKLFLTEFNLAIIYSWSLWVSIAVEVYTLMWKVLFLLLR